MRRTLLSYELPPGLIAARPLDERDGARLLVLDPGALRHASIRDLPTLIPAGALLVVNDTRVLPARLLGHKEGSGGRVEIFLVERVGLDRGSMETLYIEAATGAALRHEAGPLLDRAHARPGDWLLSRRTVEGLTLSGEAYEALARVLAGRYDLRQLDDAYRYHFFGKK